MECGVEMMRKEGKKKQRSETNKKPNGFLTFDNKKVFRNASLKNDNHSTHVCI